MRTRLISSYVWVRYFRLCDHLKLLPLYPMSFGVLDLRTLASSWHQRCFSVSFSLSQSSINLSSSIVHLLRALRESKRWECSWPGSSQIWLRTWFARRIKSALFRFGSTCWSLLMSNPCFSTTLMKIAYSSSFQLSVKAFKVFFYCEILGNSL